MKKLKEPGGVVISGDSAEELVLDLKNQSRFESEKTIEEFMRDYAQRVWTWNSNRIRSDSPENFIYDLVGCGELESW